jgi:membrane carboxypeptidase/penicillin-binding protein
MKKGGHRAALFFGFSPHLAWTILEGTPTLLQGETGGRPAGGFWQKTRQEVLQLIDVDRPTAPSHAEKAMTQRKTEEALPETRRKEIFSALVDYQEQMAELNVAQSRKVIAEKFGISDSQLKKIEREGIDEQWPPL